MSLSVSFPHSLSVLPSHLLRCLYQSLSLIPPLSFPVTYYDVSISLFPSFPLCPSQSLTVMSLSVSFPHSLSVLPSHLLRCLYQSLSLIPSLSCHSHFCDVSISLFPSFPLCPATVTSVMSPSVSFPHSPSVLPSHLLRCLYQSLSLIPPLSFPVTYCDVSISLFPSFPLCPSQSLTVMSLSVSFPHSLSVLPSHLLRCLYQSLSLIPSLSCHSHFCDVSISLFPSFPLCPSQSLTAMSLSVSFPHSPSVLPSHLLRCLYQSLSLIPPLSFPVTYCDVSISLFPSFPLCPSQSLTAMSLSVSFPHSPSVLPSHLL